MRRRPASSAAPQVQESVGPWEVFTASCSRVVTRISIKEAHTASQCDYAPNSMLDTIIILFAWTMSIHLTLGAHAFLCQDGLQSHTIPEVVSAKYSVVRCSLLFVGSMSHQSD